MEILQVRIATVFMLDPALHLFIRKLGEKGYITPRVRPTLEGVDIGFIEPPSVIAGAPAGVIAGKGNIKIDYNLVRRALGIESPIPEEVIKAVNEVEDILKEIGIDLKQKALIPYEVIVIAEEFLKPKFEDNVYLFEDILGFNLRLAKTSFIMDKGDPSSNKWFHMEIFPLWGAYKPEEKKNPHRLTITYRDEKSKLLNFLEHLEDILKKLIDKV
ncbi:hypothetical protein H5T87_02685 [bacterium]|nr:hypothetical protein [bacterium]